MSGNLDLIYGTHEDSSFIIRYFEDFYCEVIRFKEQIDSYFPSNPVPESIKEKAETEEESATEKPKIKPEEPSNTHPSPEVINQHLFDLLNRQAIDAARYGGEFAAKYYQEAQFIMTALADEVFLHLDWPGRSYWENNLLESRLYNTHMAGELFFTKLNDFLKVRDPSRADIAMLYLLALGLGFKGKYRESKTTRDLDHYRRELYIFINHHDPTIFKLGTQIFPEAYLHTLEEGKLIYLNEFKPWAIFFSALILIMVFVSYAVWQSTTGEVNTLTNNIIKHSKLRL